MKEVQAVKDLDIVKVIPVLLEKHHGKQFAQVWSLGVNCALRISDLLDIKFSDIKADKLTVKESKTGKIAVIHLNSAALAIVESIKAAFPADEYLFQSHGRNVKTVRPLTRQAVGQAFKAVGEIVDVHLSTHSMRKTRGYHLYQQTGKIEPIMKMLRHSSTAVTLRYIGIEQDDIDSSFENLVL